MTTYRLRVDPIGCRAHGLCAELLPEMISLDEWGYPLIDGAPVPRKLMSYARHAVAGCPTLALRLDRAPADRSRPGYGSERGSRSQGGEAHPPAWWRRRCEA